jgi:hypothetical protein
MFHVQRQSIPSLTFSKPFLKSRFLIPKMLLSQESHRLIEAFHREYHASEALKLPPVHIHQGRVARWLTHTFHIGAITFGRHIFIKPELTELDAEGKWTAPGWLVAHETTHVLQYTSAGWIGFLLTYLREYWDGLRALGSWDAAARMAAYKAIKVECDARDAEQAYAAWKARSASESPSADV